MFSRRNLLQTFALLPGLTGVPSVAKAANGTTRAVLDTDTHNEIDDQFAVAYAMLAPRVIRLEAIYAAPFLNSRSKSPEDGMEQSYDEIFRVLEQLGRTGFKEVYKGSRTFMRGPGRPVDSPAARNLIERAMSGSERLFVLTIGAPTNVSSAILMEPKIKDHITVVWLGGRPYDHATAEEFNLGQDIHASRVLYDSGVRLINVPTTGVSEKLRITTDEMEQALKGKSPIADYLCGIFAEAVHEDHPGSSDIQAASRIIWDISVIAWMVNPGWVKTTMVTSPILRDGLTWGRSPDRHGVRVATDVNRDRIFADLFERLTKAR